MFRIETHTDALTLLRDTINAKQASGITSVLQRLPIVKEHDYYLDGAIPLLGWHPGKLHWVPLGRERGNAGRVNLAAEGLNAIAERVVNAMEALIELERQR